MPQKADISFAFGLPPAKAIKYFRSKGHVISWNWSDTLGAAHSKAFTVAKVTNMDVLQDIRSEVDKAISEGMTFAEFRKSLEPKLKKRGWWGKKFVVGPEGKTEEILEGSPHRLKHIYRQNMQSAFNAGREEFFLENIDNRPFGMYVAVLDSRTRHTHRELHGKVYRLDDPFWDSFTPPIDHGCRCRKRALSQRALDKRGINVQSSKGKLGKRDELLSTKTGELRSVTFIRDANGNEIATGIGFDFNPAKAAWQPDLDSYDLDIATQYLKGAVTGPDFGRFFAGKVEGNFPVGRIDDVAKGIETNSNVVKLSHDSLLKNRGLLERSKGHPELTNLDYELLPEVLSNAQVVVRHGDNKFQFFYEKKGIVYSAATKVTGNGEIFLQTFFKSRASYRNSRMKKGVVIRNVLP